MTNRVWSLPSGIIHLGESIYMNHLRRILCGLYFNNHAGIFDECVGFDKAPFLGAEGITNGYPQTRQGTIDAFFAFIVKNIKCPEVLVVPDTSKHKNVS